MALILALMALATLRMKCFWGPYICIFAAVTAADKNIWLAIANKLNSNQGKSAVGGEKDNWKMVLFMRHIMMIFIMIILYNSFKDGIYKELENLR